MTEADAWSPTQVRNAPSLHSVLKQSKMEVDVPTPLGSKKRVNLGFGFEIQYQDFCNEILFWEKSHKPYSSSQHWWMKLLELLSQVVPGYLTSQPWATEQRARLWGQCQAYCHETQHIVDNEGHIYKPEFTLGTSQALPSAWALCWGITDSSFGLCNFQPWSR